MNIIYFHSKHGGRIMYLLSGILANKIVHLKFCKFLQRYLRVPSFPHWVKQMCLFQLWSAHYERLAVFLRPYLRHIGVVFYITSVYMSAFISHLHVFLLCNGYSSIFFVIIRNHKMVENKWHKSYTTIVFFHRLRLNHSKFCTMKNWTLTNSLAFDLVYDSVTSNG